MAVPVAAYPGAKDTELTLDLCSVEDADFIRSSARAWGTWAQDHGQAEPMFNWIAVYNYNNAQNGSEVFVLQGKFTEALLLVRESHVVRCDGGWRPPSVYVAFLEVAPWNRRSMAGRRYRGLGTTLLRVAADYSRQRGSGGPIALHSIAAAETFYRALGFDAINCPNEYNEMYFEMDERRAGEFLG